MAFARSFSCNLNAMQADQAFLQTALNNADDYDAFIRDLFQPWSEKLFQVHQTLDQVLQISHQDPAT